MMTMNERPADRLAIAVAQLNPIVGDVAGNLERARAARARAARDKADIVAFSELFIAGYPPEDLVLKPAFQAACRAAVEAFAGDTDGVAWSINESGQAVGSSGTCTSFSIDNGDFLLEKHPMLWTDGAAINLVVSKGRPKLG